MIKRVSKQNNFVKEENIRIKPNSKIFPLSFYLIDFFLSDDKMCNATFLAKQVCDEQGNSKDGMWIFNFENKLFAVHSKDVIK